MARNVRKVIEATFHDVLTQSGLSLNGSLRDDTILLESGLDSLGFAILVARLDEDLGYDPFSIAEEAYYPITFRDFVGFYETHQPA